MATKKKTSTVKMGDYVRVNKTTIGVVCGFDQVMNEDNYEYEDSTEYCYVASVDRYGETNRNLERISRLKKIQAPQYVVVWSDHYNDPFCQFETRADALKFAAKQRKNSDIVEVRVYKLTK